MVRIITKSLLLCAGIAGLAQPASAIPVAPLLDECAAPAEVTSQFAPSYPANFAPALATSKSAAILGGVSAFERIRLEQAASRSPATQLVRADVAAFPTAAALTPGSAPAPCNRLAMPPAGPAPGIAPGLVHRLPRSDDFLQTRRLSVSSTPFDQQWNRVSRETLSRGVVTGNAALRRYAAGPVGEEALAAVNAWTNRRIRFVEDSRLYGRADHWAGARTTLQRRAGDCEDIAIAKMQLLAAMGVARSDMYLTIARDLARHADHAVLVVKLDGRYWLLDNATDRVLDAGASYDYQPVLSFSAGRKWLHGAVLAVAN